jgi:lactoylglutathione lyase
MKLNHVTIQCRDLQKSVDFYRDIAGLDIVNDFTSGPRHIVFLTNGEGETCIELIDNPDAAYEGAGISLGFGCEDVDAYREKLAGLGYDPTPMIQPNPHVKFFFVKDPDGVQVQFI